MPDKNAESRPQWWKWAIALTASLGAMLEIIDTSIVNVALNDMQGNLGATLSEIGWVITGYAMANVIIIPLSAWLGVYFGKKSYFIFSLIGFVLASVLCGLSTSLPMLLAARVLQGLTGGGLLAKAQAILFETFSKEEQGLAQAVFGLGVIIGPTIGPTLGGYITDTIGWRWIFFINVPFGILAVLCAWIFFDQDKPDPKRSKKIDWWGIGFLCLGLGALQTMLEEGQQHDWFSSPFILLMGILSVIGIVLFIWQELTTDQPAVNLSVLRYRSLTAGCIFSMILGMGLYGALFAIPIFAQQLLQFTAMKTGMLLVPGALASAAMMLICGQLVRWIDPRLMIAIGAIILAFTMFVLSGINPGSGEDSFFWPLIWRGVGTVLMYLPLSLATFGPIPHRDISAASGLYNLTRQIGGSLGIAILTTVLSQRQNLHRSMLTQHITHYNPIVRQQLQAYAHGFQTHGVPAAIAQHQALSLMDRIVNLQAEIMSFGDVFWLVGITFMTSLLLLFFLGRGQHSEASMEAH